MNMSTESVEQGAQKLSAKGFGLFQRQLQNLCMIESRLGHLIERRVVEGFEPKKARAGFDLELSAQT